MSKALRYLGAVRPEAAGHLLGFYKHSVKALDDKTRFLIQIVTKVAVGTERGLRQYAPKALKAGASKEEILDAVMMAFPASGLNKLLDAIEVLRDLDLLPEAPGEQKEVGDHVLGVITSFPMNKMTCVHRPDGDLIVFRTGPETAKVYLSRCPHSKTTLCKGVDHGDRVECRMHNWVFDLASGRCLGPDPEGKAGLIECKVRVEGGRLIRVD
ncbi:MAG: Rieske 2Fe-2S domain-containing protein [Magnetococcales bacterium]|nr:Rieske 2Fe-2S domain-containing protein [Magnetococcales bacterium]MBF0150593.1 Rieske 2Fe-2S domain-containing protein [Magnetococcales bacterium]MBF0171844.1 Rieske 2Fe-2S domain-containing protein [Magnetococcales bacterium]MBF0346114.1 Rieske 2Fe-2S domain-containing protein [Magnetococcales bacterium]MBF0632345.1 Rieske 2Fe-2S domain-containing protein [Magnetococcales bacterium]